MEPVLSVYDKVLWAAIVVVGAIVCFGLLSGCHLSEDGWKSPVGKTYTPECPGGVCPVK